MSSVEYCRGDFSPWHAFGPCPPPEPPTHIRGGIAQFADVCDLLRDDTDSPIEYDMAFALLFGATVRRANAIYVWRPDGQHYAKRMVGGLRPDDVCIVLQAPIAGYRVDLLVTMNSRHFGRETTVIVECDGHDFHEKTKEQASHDKRRDRELQAVAPVMRFTGSEIHRDPGRCASEVFALIAVLECKRFGERPRYPGRTA